MTSEEFARLTQRIIAREGFDELLPTACFPAACELRVLQGYPAAIVPADVVRQWARSCAPDDAPYLLAFKIDDARFQVDRVEGDVVTSREFVVDGS